jgi:hypothetical protein
MAGLSNAEKQALVSVVLGEARGEGPKGMTAVAQVIKNRMESGKYPNSALSVIAQPHQFSAYSPSNPTYGYGPGSPVYDNALSAIEGVFGGTAPDETGGALQYHANYVNPGWSAPYGTKVIGNQTFYPRQASSAKASSSPSENQLLANYVNSGDYMVDPNTAIGGPPTTRPVKTTTINANPLTNQSLQDYVNSGGYAASKQSVAPASLTDNSNWWNSYTPSVAATARPTAPAPAPAPNSASNNSTWAKLLGADTSYREPTLLGNGGGGAFKTNSGISGTVQLPANVRPNVTIPSSSGSSSNSNSWTNLVNSLASPDNSWQGETNTPSIGYVSDKTDDRLTPSPRGLPANYGTSLSTTSQPKTITQQVTNPAYSKWASLSGGDDPYQNAAFAYAMQDVAPPKLISREVPNPAYRPPVAAAPAPAPAPAAQPAPAGNWFNGTPLGHIISFMQGQQPVGKAGLLGGLTGMMSGISAPASTTTQAQRDFYDRPTPNSLAGGDGT